MRETERARERERDGKRDDDAAQFKDAAVADAVGKIQRFGSDSAELRGKAHNYRPHLRAAAL